MNMTAQIQAKPTPTPSFTPVRTNLLQRKCACGGTPGPSGECAECRKKRLQRKAANQAEPSAVPSIVHEVLRSPGQPLDEGTRHFMEPRFGHDFSQVQVHTDAKAASSARAVNAIAYTVGSDIVFGTGRYAPSTPGGRHLIAHELAHVVQQSDASADEIARTPLDIGASTNSAETEAAAAADALLAGARAPVSQREFTLRLQRAPWGTCPTGRRLSAARPAAYASAELYIAETYYRLGSDRKRNVVATNINRFEDMSTSREPERTLLERTKEAFRSGGNPQRRRATTGKVENAPTPGQSGEGVLESVEGAEHAMVEVAAAMAPDIIDFTRREVYDVTTRSVANAKRAKVAGYAGLLTRVTMMPWSAGNTLKPPGMLSYPYNPLKRNELICYGITDFAKWPGAILYAVIDTSAGGKKKDDKKKEEKKGKKPGGKGGNYGIGIAINSTGGGKGNAGIGIAINSSGTSYGTAGAGIVYDSHGNVIGTVGAGVSSGSTATVAGGAGVGAARDTDVTAAGAAGAGAAQRTKVEVAGVAGAGTAQDLDVAAVGAAGTGEARDVTGHAEGKAPPEAGATGAGKGQSVPAPQNEEFKSAQAEARRAEKALGGATPAQVELLRWLASHYPNRIMPVQSGEWFEKFVAATKHLTPEQIKQLQQAKWEPDPGISVEEFRRRVDGALARGADAPGAAVHEIEKEARKSQEPASSEQKVADKPEPRAETKTPDPAAEQKILEDLWEQMKRFNYKQLRRDQFFVSSLEPDTRATIYFKLNGQCYGARVTVDKVEDGNATYVTVKQSSVVVRLDGTVFYDNRFSDGSRFAVTPQGGGKK